jgi:DNA primase
LIRYSKEEILKSISILDIANAESIALERISSGNFTHRCKCPSKEHKSGSERTGSLYIDGDNNNFYCFGCGATNNVIDFYILCTNLDFSGAITELSSLVDPDKVQRVASGKKKTNFYPLLQLSEVFREALKAHPEDIEWIEKVMKRADQHIESIDRYDVKRTKSLLTKIKGLIRRRYS